MNELIPAAKPAGKHHSRASGAAPVQPGSSQSGPFQSGPAPRGHKRMSPLVTLLWVAHAVLLVCFAAQDVGLEGQYLLGAAALAGLAILHIVKPTGAVRVLGLGQFPRSAGVSR